MEVDIGQRAAFGGGGIFELHMIKIDSAVRNLVNRVFRVLQAARLAQHLADTLAGRLRHGEHDEDHGKHHQAHEDLHGIGDHAGQAADAEVRAAGRDDKLRGENEIRIIDVYTQNCITGLLSAEFSPPSKSPRGPNRTRRRTSASHSPRAKLLTTRMPCTFSCTELLRASYF